MNASLRVLGGVTVLTCAGAVATVRYGIQGRSSQLFGRSIHRGPGSRQSIALTFDDGPSEETPRLLEYLEQEGIRATFFQCGLNAERHPDLARQVSEAGHEIGNHTYSHMRLCPRFGRSLNLRSLEEIHSEIARTQDVLRDIHGVTPTLFRAPYGLRWIGVEAAQRELGLLGVMWTVIGHDWEWPANEISSYVLKMAQPGGIVCLHDGRDIQQTVDISPMMDALRTIVPILKQQGYTFETVSELLVPDGS